MGPPLPLTESLFFSVCPRLIWEETLQDSLLHFAATPKGLLLLHSTGALDRCVAYMYSRFTKKLQVPGGPVRDRSLGAWGPIRDTKNTTNH